MNTAKTGHTCSSYGSCRSDLKLRRWERDMTMYRVRQQGAKQKNKTENARRKNVSPSIKSLIKRLKTLPFQELGQRWKPLRPVCAAGNTSQRQAEQSSHQTHKAVCVEMRYARFWTTGETMKILMVKEKALKNKKETVKRCQPTG